MKAFVINVDRCSGCYSCQLACKDEHCGNDWTPYAKPQPETGQFWGRLNEYVRGQVQQVKMSYVFVPCQHCENAPCIDACTIEGALSTRDDGLVWINPKKCTGCRSCIDACPYNVIFYNETLHLAQKCTGCAHLIDRSSWGYGTRCSDACPHESIKFGEKSELNINETEILHPEYGLTTKVYYKGLPKRFVAGTIYDPGTKEIISGATCTLSGVAGDTSTTSDDFGDFWLDGLGKGTFTLTISNGSKTKTITGDTTDKDIGLGDIALS
jgi:Fe-S-cluster-containing dehydrogenase component